MLSFFKKKQLKKLIIMAVSVLSLTQVLSFATPSLVYAEGSSDSSGEGSSDDSGDDSSDDNDDSGDDSSDGSDEGSSGGSDEGSSEGSGESSSEGSDEGSSGGSGEGSSGGSGEGSDNNGTDGSGNNGTDGSDNNGTDGSDNNGTDGSGNNGTDGSGNNGTDGSGNNGTDGSGNNGTDGSGNDLSGSDNNTATLMLLSSGNGAPETNEGSVTDPSASLMGTDTILPGSDEPAPTDPALTLTDPASASTDPASASTDPVLTLTDPASVPADPALTVTDPASVPADPAPALTDPALADPAPDAAGLPAAPADAGVTYSDNNELLKIAPANDNNAASNYNVTYDYNATLFDPTPTAEGERPGGDYAGVYKTGPLEANNATAENAPTIGLPSIADANLDKPTLESPAIIQGAAVGYEEKTGDTEYTTIKERVEPYSEYKVTIMDETGADGTVHKKVTGFDGTYVIARLDVSQFYGEDTNGKYLHMKQEQNMALIPGAGMADNDKAFIEQKTGTKTGSYSIDDLIDKVKGAVTPFIDVILFATAGNVSGADAGKEGSLNGDVPIQFYVDNVADYNPDLKYDPASTDPNHSQNVLAKFFDATKAAVNSISHFLIKGSDLALEVAVENSGGENKDKGTTYWSLKKAFEDPYYDQEADRSPDDEGSGRTVKLISEVAITDSVDLKGTDANNLRKRTLDVNSYDVQIATNTSPDTQTYPDAFTLENAWLTIKDSSNTTGAELAIGNNADMVIGQGGKLIIDESCQLEIEWDGGTTAPGSTPASPDILNDGILDLRAGGEIINNGILTIEGYEGKPHDPAQEVDPNKGCGEFTIEEGAKFVNNGCLMLYGKLYNLGTLINNGRYNDLIISNDPDKGQFAYHKGIIISWKDDVTQPNVYPGTFFNGQDRDGNVYANAMLLNNGDILLFPGTLNNYGCIASETGNIYLAEASEAIIPIEPTPEAPNVEEKRITLSPPVKSYINNYGTILLGNSHIKKASVVLNDDTSLGALTVIDDGRHHSHSSKKDSDNNNNNNNPIGAITAACACTGQKLIVPFQGGTMVSGGTNTNECFKLFLYADKTFLFSLKNGKVLGGSFRIADNSLVFVTDDGTVVNPVIDPNGDHTYSFRISGSDVSFTLKADTVGMLKKAV